MHHAQARLLRLPNVMPVCGHKSSWSTVQSGWQSANLAWLAHHEAPSPGWYILAQPNLLPILTQPNFVDLSIGSVTAVAALLARHVSRIQAKHYSQQTRRLIPALTPSDRQSKLVMRRWAWICLLRTLAGHGWVGEIEVHADVVSA